jgi:hypothetical protein
MTVDRIRDIDEAVDKLKAIDKMMRENANGFHTDTMTMYLLIDDPRFQVFFFSS